MRQIVVDTETTGLDPNQGHKIIEIACLEITDRRLGKHFHCYINPQRKIDEGAFAVHGISNEFLADKPCFSEVKAELINFIQGSELIIHNAPFDTSFLNCELGTNDGPIERHCQIIDTLVLARQLHPGQKNSLDALCKRYGVDNSKRDRHGALLDAELLALVYLAMTGGQGSLFGDEQRQEIQTQRTPQMLKRQQHAPLAVIKATADELAAHQAYLTKLEKEGGCLWSKDKMQ